MLYITQKLKCNNHYMKINLLIIALLFSVTLVAQKKVNKWSDGTVKSEGAYAMTGLKNGLWKFYYPNGNLEAEGTYNGQHSPKTIEVIHQRRGSAIEDEGAMRDGKWTFYYSNGQKKGEIVYEEGCPTGTLQKWYKTGEKMEESEYIDCKPLGNKKVWHRDGWLKYETVQKENSRSIEMEYYANGQKKSMIPYKKGQQYGRVKRWYKNGQKEEDVMMKNTRVHGSYRSWHNNGKRKREFFSINNVMSGEYREWTKEGYLLWEIIELTDEKKISVKNFWSNGQVKMKGKAKMPPSLSIHQWSQTRDGYWIYYYKDGTVLKSEKYSNGQLINVQMP